MIRKRNKGLLCLLFVGVVLMTRCTVRDDLIGLYVSPNLINNDDTLWLNENGSYLRKLYCEDSLVLVQKDKWSFSDNYLQLNNLFIDLDKKYAPNFDFKSRVGHVSSEPESYKGSLKWHYGYFPDDKFFYLKVR